MKRLAWYSFLMFVIALIIVLDQGVIAQVVAPSPSPSAAVVASSGLLAWLQSNMTMILAVLLGISETLALIPAIQANSIFQAVYNVLKTLAPKTPQS